MSSPECFNHNRRFRRIEAFIRRIVGHELQLRLKQVIHDAATSYTAVRVGIGALFPPLSDGFDGLSDGFDENLCLSDGL
jgi:hypothetical protein